jgi:hypothetical protein
MLVVRNATVTVSVLQLNRFLCISETYITYTVALPTPCMRHLCNPHANDGDNNLRRQKMIS